MGALEGTSVGSTVGITDNDGACVGASVGSAEIEKAALATVKTANKA